MNDMIYENNNKKTLCINEKMKIGTLFHYFYFGLR